MNRYFFREALGLYLHVQTSTVRKWLPPDLHPLEAQPGHAILALTSFDFVDSEVGPYGELVISVLVPPFASRGGELPHAATFPIILLTTTEASAAHNFERWRLPRFERSVEMEFLRDGNRRTLRVRDGQVPLLTMSVERHRGVPSSRLYQVFTDKDGQLNRANVRFIGELDEHQDETGRLELFSHPLAERLAGALLDDIPVVEQSMDAGEEQYSDPVPHRLESV